MQSSLAYSESLGDEHAQDDIRENRLPMAERRRYLRFKLELAGRFMREDKTEFTCKLADVSVGAAAIETTTAVRPGEKIIAYFDHLGGVEGIVFRLFEGGFVFTFNASPAKRERLAAQLTLLINADELEPEDLRRKGHERIKVTDKTTTVILDDGTKVAAVLGDVSVSGAMLNSELKPAIGALLTVGRLRSKVVRHHATGFAVQFQNPDGTDIIAILAD